MLRAVPGYYGFGTAMPWNPLSLDAGLMTYSRLPLLSKRYLKFQAQTDAISRGALFCVIKLSHGKQILHINVHLSPSLVSNSTFIRALQIDELCDHIQESYSTLSSSIILVGDLNIEYGSNTRFQQLNVALFVGNERDPKSELVDYILVSEELGVVEELRAIEQGQGAFGDHLPIAATVRIFTGLED
ncbi:Endonuclease/exonuclease/phosphatase [Chytridium lagenaria]|nr:Endonuclease/exonuclease/phosphatase [Chytridium lagenaria]